MLAKFYSLYAKITGKHAKSAPASLLWQQMREPRALPMGIKEFHEWSNRLIGGAMIPGATEASQKFALAEMVMHLKPTEDHCDDAFFIKSLRKGAVNQVCFAMMEQLRNERKAALEKEEADRKLKAESMETAQSK